jgi:unsaturated rhamnogalacturonyl hydrolase
VPGLKSRPISETSFSAACKARQFMCHLPQAEARCYSGRQTLFWACLSKFENHLLVFHRQSLVVCAVLRLGKMADGVGTVAAPCREFPTCLHRFSFVNLALFTFVRSRNSSGWRIDLYSLFKLLILVLVLVNGVAMSQSAVGPSAAKTASQVDREASGDSPADAGPRATGLSSALDPASIEVVMRKVADWQIATAESRFNQQWTFAALYDGLLATSKATGDARYAGAVERAAIRFDWRMLDTRFPHADDEAIGRAYVDLYQLHPSPERIRNAREILDRLMARPDEPGKPVWWWCDALFMAPPVLARMSALTGNPKYLAYMDHEWSITSELLYNRQERLFWRDASYLKKTEKNGKPLFWARGNGWVLAGLAQVLTYMPANDPLRPKYVAQFREMAQRIAGLQGADGLWKTGLLDPDSYNSSEVSGSAFFTYGMAWGLNNGLLDEHVFRPVVERAWAGMTQRIYASGRLGSIQPIGAAPDAFVPSSSYVYGVGGFLLAGNELHRLSMRK